MKFAIAGIGSIGRRHLKNLLSLGEQNIVFLRSMSSTLPDDDLLRFPIETNIKALLAHKPDAIIIPNPTSLHLDVAIPAAEAGCHILLEKPISHSLKGLSEFQNIVNQGKSNVLVGFQYRFHPTLKIASQIIANGEIGQIVSVHAHWGEYLPSWHPWEDYRQSYAARKDLGGGVVLTLCHPFDYLNWLFGKPELQWARIGTMGNLDISVEDIAEVCLRFPNGAFGFVHLDYIQKPSMHFLEAIGTNGTLRWNNEDGKLTIYKNNNAQWESFSTPVGFERNWPFLEEMRHFIAVARSEVSPLCTLDDGIYALKIGLQTLSFSSNSII